MCNYNTDSQCISKTLNLLTESISYLSSNIFVVVVKPQNTKPQTLTQKMETPGVILMFVLQTINIANLCIFLLLQLHIIIFTCTITMYNYNLQLHSNFVAKQ